MTSIPRKELGVIVVFVVGFICSVTVREGLPEHSLAEESQSHEYRLVMIKDAARTLRPKEPHTALSCFTDLSGCDGRLGGDSDCSVRPFWVPVMERLL